MPKPRKGIPVRWDPNKIKGEAILYVFGPVKGWRRKKSGLNDGEFLVSFPADFVGTRDAFVIGSEGGFTEADIVVE